MNVLEILQHVRDHGLPGARDLDAALDAIDARLQGEARERAASIVLAVASLRFRDLETAAKSLQAIGVDVPVA